MILRCVTLAGFLCYREEQTVRFDAAGLWVLSGPNGSGKSAILDAVTYALYGEIRGSRHSVDDLINHHVDRLRVDMEFEIDGRIFGIQRTRRRKGGVTVGAYEVVGTNPNGSPQIDPISDTDNAAGLRRWVDQTIGLGVDAFISSVLLRQGQSDRLLSLPPRERATVLNQLIDLSRYRHLFDSVRDGRKVLAETVKGIEEQLRSIPEVTDEALAAAAFALGTAERIANEADAEVQRLGELLPVAERVCDIKRELKEVRRKLEIDCALIERQEQIERDQARWAELSGILPDLVLTVRGRQRAAEFHAQVAASDKEITTLTERSREAEAELAGAQSSLAEIDDALEKLRFEQDQVHHQLDDVAPLAAMLSEMEQRELELTAALAELERFPANLAEQIAAAEVGADKLDEITTALPWL